MTTGRVHEEETFTKTVGFFSFQTTQRKENERQALSHRISQGHLYLVRAEGSNHYKIGTTKKLPERITQLSVWNPLVVSLVYSTRSQVLENRKKEKSLHEKYASYRLKGEWFDFPEKIIPSVVKDIILLEFDGEIK